MPPVMEMTSELVELDSFDVDVLIDELEDQSSTEQSAWWTRHCTHGCLYTLACPTGTCTQSGASC